MNTLYWYDYETFGTDPRYDRLAQFAGVRTDEALNIIGKPLMLYCKQAEDSLPHPRACLSHGLSPQHVAAQGLIEAELSARIHHEISQANTCTVGYNNLRFDDEFTRCMLYRNFYDPYAREWQHGNSRWDIIDLVRLTRALRPDGINWPDKDDGTPSFTLEDLTKTNNIEHQNAHDALSDVHATIALAKRIKTAQPKLYDFVYKHRRKEAVAHLLTIGKPIIHVSRRYPSEYCGAAVVVPIARHPTYHNRIVVYDLRHDPSAFIDEDSDTLRQWLFTPKDELPKDATRPAIKTLQLNKCPVVAPVNTLTDTAAERLHIDRDQHNKHLTQINSAGDLSAKIAALFRPPDDATLTTTDPDACLYSGGFFSDEDKWLMAQVRAANPAALSTLSPPFADKRLPEMLFRYRARNWPDSLKAEEQATWRDYCKWRLNDEASPALTFSRFEQAIADCQADHLSDTQRALLTHLIAYATTLKKAL